MCGCCSVFRPDHSCLDFTAFKPRAARTSFRSSGAAIHAPRDSLHSCSLIGQLFRSRERRDGVGSASNNGSFYAVVWQEWHLIGKLKKNMLLILFMSWIRPDWTHCSQLFIHRSVARGASSHLLCVAMMLSDVAVVQPTAARVLSAPYRRTCCTQTS